MILFDITTKITLSLLGKEMILKVQLYIIAFFIELYNLSTSKLTQFTE